MYRPVVSYEFFQSAHVLFRLIGKLKLVSKMMWIDVLIHDHPDKFGQALGSFYVPGGRS